MDLLEELRKLRIIPSGIRREIEKLVAVRDKYTDLYAKYDDVIKIVTNGELLSAIKYLTGNTPWNLLINYKETLKHIETLKILLILNQKEMYPENVPSVEDIEEEVEREQK